MVEILKRKKYDHYPGEGNFGEKGKEDFEEEPYLAILLELKILLFDLLF